MGTIHVSVSHEYDLVVSQPFGIKLLMNTRTQCINDGLNLAILEDLLHSRLLDIEDLPAQGQDGLNLGVTPLLGRAASGVTLDDKDLTVFRVIRLAIREFAWKGSTSEQPLA